MCGLTVLPDIIEAGVYSLKIEGRMKNVNYAAGVTGIYRKYVDHYLEYGREGFKVEDRYDLAVASKQAGKQSAAGIIPQDMWDILWVAIGTPSMRSRLLVGKLQGIFGTVTAILPYRPRYVSVAVVISLQGQFQLIHILWTGASGFLQAVCIIMDARCSVFFLFPANLINSSILSTSKLPSGRNKPMTIPSAPASQYICTSSFNCSNSYPS